MSTPAIEIVGANVDLVGNHHLLHFGLPIVSLDKELVRPKSMDWTRESLRNARKIPEDSVPYWLETPVEIGDRDQLGVVVVGASFGSETLRSEIAAVLCRLFDAESIHGQDIGDSRKDFVTVVPRDRILVFRSSLRRRLEKPLWSAIRDRDEFAAEAALAELVSSSTLPYDDYIVFGGVVATVFQNEEARADFARSIERRGLLDSYNAKLASLRNVRRKVGAPPTFNKWSLNLGKKNVLDIIPVSDVDEGLESTFAKPVVNVFDRGILKTPETQAVNVVPHSADYSGKPTHLISDEGVTKIEEHTNG